MCIRDSVEHVGPGTNRGTKVTKVWRGLWWGLLWVEMPLGRRVIERPRLLTRWLTRLLPKLMWVGHVTSRLIRAMRERLHIKEGSHYCLFPPSSLVVLNAEGGTEVDTHNPVKPTVHTKIPSSLRICVMYRYAHWKFSKKKEKSIHTRFFPQHIHTILTT